VQAVILAAGLGRRLGALTRHSTKFMVPVNGRPIGAYALEALAEAGISRIVLVVGHAAEEVRQRT
jgi:NDP-sugar pyrophosphorylase family protein